MNFSPSYPCCFTHTRQPLGHAILALCRVRVGLMSVLLDQRPSLLTLRRRLLIFVRMIHRYYSAVRLLDGVHVGRTAIAFSHRSVVWFTSDISEVSRFSCMEFPDVRGVYDYAGPAKRLALSFPAVLPSALRQRRRPDCNFSKLDTQPACAPVYASLCHLASSTQNSGSSGSLLLSRKALSSSTPCRFIPAHRQPVFRSSLQNHEVPAGIPGPLWFDSGCPPFLPGVLPLV